VDENRGKKSENRRLKKKVTPREEGFKTFRIKCTGGEGRPPPRLRQLSALEVRAGTHRKKRKEGRKNQGMEDKQTCRLEKNHNESGEEVYHKNKTGKTETEVGLPLKKVRKKIQVTGKKGGQACPND